MPDKGLLFLSMEKGLVQLYYGDGKGKTTAAVGSAVRAAGCGMKVLFYQFLKKPVSGEVSILKSIDNIFYTDNSVADSFLFNLDTKQQEYYRRLYKEETAKIKEGLFSAKYDMVILDEAIDAFSLKILDPEDLYDMMENKPETTELIITGHKYKDIPIDELIKRSDYVSCIQKIKHPFDCGQMQRRGIEV